MGVKKMGKMDRVEVLERANYSVSFRSEVERSEESQSLAKTEMSRIRSAPLLSLGAVSMFHVACERTRHISSIPLFRESTLEEVRVSLYPLPRVFFSLILAPNPPLPLLPASLARKTGILRKDI